LRGAARVAAPWEEGEEEQEQEEAAVVVVGTGRVIYSEI